MKSIFIGIPTIRDHQEFIKSIDNFIPELKKNFVVDIYRVVNEPIDIARNKIVDNFLESKLDYLLFLDDDHCGHTVDMVESLMKLNTYVCAIKCYQKNLKNELGL